MTQVVRLMPAKCGAAQLFLSEFVHGMSRCGWRLFSLAPTSMKAKVLQNEFAEAW